MEIIYVRKPTPSGSGLALYAATFSSVLERLGRVAYVDAPPGKREGQSLRESLRGLTTGLKLRRSTAKLVHIELGGRCLFEFYLLLGLTLGRQKPPLKVSITCHDPPSLVGASTLFTVLDRRGRRRLGNLLYRVAGRRLERRVVTRATYAFALTQAGAAALQEIYKRPVSYLPHIAYPCDAPPHKLPTIFVPGYLNTPETVIELLKQLEPGWTVVVGACDTPARLAIERAAQKLAVSDSLRFTGQLSEADLLATFERSAAVARLRSDAPAANNLAASGPLMWAASFGCLIITNDQRAGAQELADAGIVLIADDVAKSMRSHLPAAYSDDLVGMRLIRIHAIAGVDAVETIFRNSLAAEDLTLMNASSVTQP